MCCGNINEVRFKEYYVKRKFLVVMFILLVVFMLSCKNDSEPEIVPQEFSFSIEITNYTSKYITRYMVNGKDYLYTSVPPYSTSAGEGSISGTILSQYKYKNFGTYDVEIEFLSGPTLYKSVFLSDSDGFDSRAVHIGSTYSVTWI